MSEFLAPCNNVSSTQVYNACIQYICFIQYNVVVLLIAFHDIHDGMKRIMCASEETVTLADDGFSASGRQVDPTSDQSQPVYCTLAIISGLYILRHRHQHHGLPLSRL